jgi:hypothetical protein
MEKVQEIYQCECGAWSRKEYKILTDGKAICTCGKEMILTQRALEPLKSKLPVIKQIEEKNNFTSDEDQIKHYCHTNIIRHGWKKIGEGCWKRVKYSNNEV